MCLTCWEYPPGVIVYVPKVLLVHSCSQNQVLFPWCICTPTVNKDATNVSNQTLKHFRLSLLIFNVALSQASDPTPVQLFGELWDSQAPQVPWLGTPSHCFTPPGLTACLPALLGSQTARGGSGRPGCRDKDHMKFPTLPHPIRKQAERNREAEGEREGQTRRNSLDGRWCAEKQPVTVVFPAVVWGSEWTWGLANSGLSVCSSSIRDECAQFVFWE